MTAENSPRTPTTAFDTSNEQDVSTLDTLDDDWPTTTPSVDQVEQERAARCLFSIPANEPLLHEAYASCKINSVYFAGRLYIFKRYLSFYTCSFGTDFRKLVPLQVCCCCTVCVHVCMSPCVLCTLKTACTSHTKATALVPKQCPGNKVR